MKHIYIENGVINGAGFCEQLDEGVLNIEVSDDVFQEFCSDKFKFAYINGQIVSNPNYEQDKLKSENFARAEEIRNELEELDKKRIRAICEDEVKNERTGETWLDYYNEQINLLRIELKSLES